MIAEDPDTAKIFGDGIFGKIQNTKAELRLLAPFRLALLPSTSRGYRSIGYLAEAENLSKHFTPIEFLVEQLENGNHYQQNTQRRLFLTTEKNVEIIEKTNNYTLALDSLIKQLSSTEMALIYSMIANTCYDYDRALHFASQAISHTPKSVLSLLNRAVILSNISKTSDKAHQKQYIQQALTDLNNAITLMPTSTYCFYNRGCLFADMGRQTEAEADFTKAISIDPYLAEAYYNRAVLLLQCGRKTSAIPDLSKAGELGLFPAYNLLKEARK